uniref:Flagellin n=1 Tax=Caldimicrobium thiodismutans TaxID=1653476 RepID=A0A832GPK3_9BACT
MAVKINFNEAAAQTHTALIRNERAMNKSLLRMSTGMRILNAADDSAGLFIADMLGTVAKAYDQGNRNIQTGISALQIAEASAAQIFDKLQEIYVRAQNAANDINDPIARQALQQEIRNFVEAIQKIGTDTEYNGIKLLDGTYKDKYIHYGARLEQTVYISISDVRAQNLGAHITLLPGSVGSATGALPSNTNYVSSSNVTASVGGRVINATIQNGTNYIYDAGYVAEQINRNLGDIGFVAKAVNISIGNKYTALADISTSATVTFFVGDKSFNFTADTTITLDQLVEKINRAAATAQADLSASVSDGRLVLTSSKGYTIGVQVALSGTTAGTINLDQLIQSASSQTSTTAHAIKVGRLYIANDRDFKISGLSATQFGTAEIGSNTNSEFKNLYSIDVTTNIGAEVALLTTQIAQRTVDSVRAQIGATMNNLQSIFDSQKVAYDNTKEAESVIRNTDYAKEMADFTTYQIRMQATIAMLAQANTLPQLVLQLMR